MSMENNEIVCSLCSAVMPTNERREGSARCRSCRRIALQVNQARNRDHSPECTKSLSVLEWKEILDHSKGRCAYCSKVVGIEYLTLDHKTPLHLGGDTTKENVAPACKRCNHRKAFSSEFMSFTIEDMGEDEIIIIASKSQRIRLFKHQIPILITMLQGKLDT